MQKYGFVYIWYDKKRKMYYIGCRWGTIGDNYICSSNRMRDAYRRRPQDFKRKILSKIYTNRIDLLNEEYRWLSLIKKEELGNKYYNIQKHHFGHWSICEYKRLTVGQKISLSPNRAKNIGIANKGKKPHDRTIEAIKKALTGKTYEEIHGYEKAQEIKEKKKLNRKSPYWSHESRKLISENTKLALKGKTYEEIYGYEKAQEMRKKRSDSCKIRHAKRIRT